MTWLEEHLDEMLERYAAEDNCTVEEFKERAIYYVVRQRYILEKHFEDADIRRVDR